VRPRTQHRAVERGPAAQGFILKRVHEAHTPILARVGRLVGWNHCPRCAAALENDSARARCAACGFVAYATSEPTACALVFDDDGRVLLARRACEPDKGKWDLPGGFLQEGEKPLDALCRELREETGLAIEPLDFVGVWTDRYGDAEDAPTTLNMYWTARIVSGEPRPHDDVSELAWFSLDELPPESELAFSNVAEALRSWRS
jgi:ADP-ribose pyrophosphatase YjhB (NUDIX family)